MRVHVAVGVEDVAASVEAYTEMLGAAPVVVVRDEYALWRTEVLNFSIRRSDTEAGRVRHVGFERDEAPGFSAQVDLNGLVWETFSRFDQAAEIKALWPDAGYAPDADDESEPGA